MKTKNKKLFALLMLPAVIAMMVLPLCSFTTVYDTDYERYSSITNVGIVYCYDYGSSGTYYGVLQNCSSVLVAASASTTSQKNSSVKFTASDYYITGSSRISMKNPQSYQSFDIDVINDLPYVDDFYDYRLALCYSCNNSNTYFNGEFYFDDFAISDDVSIVFIYGGDIFSLNNVAYDLSLEFDISYLYMAEDIGVEPDFTHEHLVYQNSGVYDWTYFGIGEFVESVINNDAQVSLSDMIYYEIDNLHFKFTPYVDQDYPLNDGKYTDLLIMSKCYNQSNIKSPLVEALVNLFGPDTPYAYGYKTGYSVGYNNGLSNIGGVWGTLGEFLTSTVGSFFEFEIWDGFNLGAVMSIFVGAMLLVAFLKLFAGG